MPLEIRELHVKVSVGEPGREPGGASANARDESGEDALIRRLVDQVLAILKERQER